jgi:hypothetical protein
VSALRDLVEQQQYFFDMLWRKAIPAKQGIKEIEHGLKREFMETIQDPHEVQTILNNILRSANEGVYVNLHKIFVKMALDLTKLWYLCLQFFKQNYK